MFDRPCVRVCVCTQGRAGRRLLIKRAIAAKLCLVINIGLSISGEELPLSVFTAEINMSRVARLPRPSHRLSAALSTPAGLCLS